LTAEESEMNSGELVAHIHDMAVLPKYQRSGIARSMLERVLDIAATYNVPIETETRESTSYQAIKHPSVADLIAQKGFAITAEKKMPAYLGGENFHFIRLEKTS